MKGAAAFRNTLKYLQQGQIVFKHDVRIMTVNMNIGTLKPGQEDTSAGIRLVIQYYSLTNVVKAKWVAFDSIIIELI